MGGLQPLDLGTATLEWLVEVDVHRERRRGDLVVPAVEQGLHDGHRSLDGRGRGDPAWRGDGRGPLECEAEQRTTEGGGRRVAVVAEDDHAKPRRDLPAHVRPEARVAPGVTDDPAAGQVLDHVEPIAIRHRLEIDGVRRRGCEPRRDRAMGLLHLAS